MKIASFALVALVSLFSCVEKGPPDKKVDEAYIQANLLSELPADIDNAMQVDFGGKVLYLGNSVSTKVLSPGGAGRIVHYWKVVEPPGADWKIFAHLNGPSGDWLNLDSTDMRTGYPSSKWKAGDIIRDEQKFALAKMWRGKSALLSVGLYKKGGQGTSARMPIIAGPKDAERRTPVYTFVVKGGSMPSQPKKTVYRIPKASEPIVIDGKATEASWKVAPMSPNFSDAEGGRAVGADTHAQLLWDDNFLYAFIQISDKDIYSQFKNQDDTLWKEDVIELFIDADRNGRGYIELQVNPNNAHFDAWFPIGRGQKHHFEWDSKMKSAVVVDGTSDSRDDTDRSWNVEIAIPLEDVKGMNAAMPVRLPPALGDKWRMNIVRGEKPKDKGLAASSWNPITIQDFHALGRMLTVEFADEEGELPVPTQRSRTLPPPPVSPVPGASSVPVPSGEAVPASTGSVPSTGLVPPKDKLAPLKDPSSTKAKAAE
ncbi:MAG: carbohydrate-binding family 9-like protein [Kofleriaceae bacterium]|nr:carbohydrate-binding family 9-like protein [Kofleriaceae bacterium]